MTRYLLEAYTPRTSRPDELEARARDAATALSEAGTPIRHITTIHIPSDEVCFHVFEASSAESVRVVGEHARIDTQRIVEAAS